MSSSERYLDITNENCPMTFVRTKLCLERMAAGEVLRVRLRDGEPLVNVPQAVADHGHAILGLSRVGHDLFELIVRKAGS